MRLRILQIAEQHRRLFEPRHDPDRRKIGLHDEIAIALRPARRLVAGHRLHIDIVGQQVVAAMRLVIGGLDEEAGEKPLADEPALHVDGAAEHRVDLARGDGLFQLLERHVSSHAFHSAAPPGALSCDRQPDWRTAFGVVAAAQTAGCLLISPLDHSGSRRENIPPSRSAHLPWPAASEISSLRISIMAQGRPRERAWRSSVK